jgi:hypothetical protein
MRRSSLRHPVALVRKIVGLAQPNFAKLVGIAESTLAKIESLHLPLSKENAIRITDETGVSMRWLLAGQTHELPTADGFRFGKVKGRPPLFDHQVFETRRAQIDAGDVSDVPLEPFNPEIELKAMAATAQARDRQFMFNHKLRAAVDDLAKDFPPDRREIQQQEAETFAKAGLSVELVRNRGRALIDLKRRHAGDGALIPLLVALEKFGIAAGALQPSWLSPRRASLPHPAARIKRQRSVKQKKKKTKRRRR